MFSVLMLVFDSVLEVLLLAVSMRKASRHVSAVTESHFDQPGSFICLT